MRPLPSIHPFPDGRIVRDGDRLEIQISGDALARRIGSMKPLVEENGVDKTNYVGFFEARLKAIDDDIAKLEAMLAQHRSERYTYEVLLQKAKAGETFTVP